MPKYLPAAGLQPCHLNAETPLGLLKCEADNRATLFWIVAQGDERVAIVLDGDAGSRFRAWALETDERSWWGLHLGQVRLEVDIEDAILSRHDNGGLGCVFIRGEDIRLCAIGRHPAERTLIKVGDSASADAEVTASFPNWRLSQAIDGSNKPLVLYESSPSTPVIG